MMRLLSDEEVGLSSGPSMRVAPEVQAERDQEAGRIRTAELEPGGGGLIPTNSVVPSVKPPEGATSKRVLSDEEVGLGGPKRGFVANLKNPVDLWLNESLPANLYQAYKAGKFNDIIKKLKLDPSGPEPTPSELEIASRPAFGVRNRRGAVSAFTDAQPGARTEPPKGDSIFAKLVAAAKDDPGRVGAELVNAIVADPYLLAAPAAGSGKLGRAGLATTGRSGAAAGRVIEGGLLGGGLNVAIEAGHGLKTGEGTHQDLIAAGTLAAVLSGPMAGALGRTKAKTPKSKGIIDDQPFVPPETPQQASDILDSLFNPVRRREVDARRKAQTQAYDLMQEGASANKVDALRKKSPLLGEELDRMIRGRADAKVAFGPDSPIQGEHLGPEAPRGPTPLPWTDGGRPMAPSPEPLPPGPKLLRGPDIEALDPQGREVAIRDVDQSAARYREEVTRLQDEIKDLEISSSRGDMKDLSGKLRSKDSTLETAKARLAELNAQRTLLTGKVPGWAKNLGIGAGVYAGAQLAGLEDEGAIALGMLGAMKSKGGMWHPKAAEALASPLIDKLTTPRGWDQIGGPLTRAEGFPLGQLDVSTNWSKKTAQNYLNKHMGTETDPLKDIEIPFGTGTKKWGEITDKLVKSSPAGRYKSFDVMQVEDFNSYAVYDYELNRVGPRFKTADEAREYKGNLTAEEVVPWAAKVPNDEPVWNIDFTKPADYGRMAQAMQSYLSHVGDYLRQNVPPEKLSQYDLVRAVKETAKHDAEVAKKMEAASSDATKQLPVHKEYPDGFKWVELKAPEKLTPEQMKQVKPKYSDSIRLDDDTAKWEAEAAKRGDKPSHWIALDSDGKALRNTYTDETAKGNTPEEAWLAGQLAREGNQMGHCVGGYCQGVVSGESRIFSLRDPKGRSHVTVEMTPPGTHSHPVQAFLKEHPEIFERVKKQHTTQEMYESDLNPEWMDMLRTAARLPEYDAWLKKFPPDIQQIKGKQNRAPNDEYKPYVQDFVRSGKWGDIGDLENTGLLKAGDKFYTEAEYRDLATQYMEKIAQDDLATQGHVSGATKDMLERVGIEQPRHLETFVEAAERAGMRPRGGREHGGIDPKLLIGLGLTAAGAVAGAAYLTDNPLLGAAAGAASPLAAAKLLRAGRKDLRQIADYALGAISTRLGNISPEIKHRARNFEHRVLEGAHEAIGRVEPFVTALERLPRPMQKDLNLAILNNDSAEIQRIIQMSGSQELSDGWKAVRSTLDEFRGKLVAEGRFKEGRADYYPRVVKDLDGLYQAIGAESRGRLEQVIRDAESAMIKKAGRGLSELEQAKVINDFLQREIPGYGQPGFAKNRRIKEVTEQLQPFYATPTESLHSYLRSAVDDIERARFFGKELKNVEVAGGRFINVPDSIGNIVRKELMAGKIDPEKADELTSLLKSRFEGGKATMGIIQDVKNLANAGLLGNIVSAATQLGDIGSTVYMQGLVPTVEALTRKLTGRAEIDVKDFGLIDHISEEFVSTRKSADFLNKVFKASLFSGIDRLGKDVNLNAALINARKQAGTPGGVKRLEAKYGRAYGEEFPQLLQDLRTRNNSELVKSFLFSELSDIQPISKIEMPQGYLDNPNGRIAYMLKTFMLKQMDLVRRDVVQEITKGNRVRGVGNLMKYSLALGISGATTDMVKDWIMGREVDFDANGVIENVLKTFGFSEYMRSKAAKSPVTTVAGMFAPPWQMFDRIVSADPKSIQHIPLVGKLYYQHFMGGKERDAERAEKKRDRELEKALRYE